MVTDIAGPAIVGNDHRGGIEFTGSDSVLTDTFLVVEEKEYYWDGTLKLIHRYDVNGNQHGEQLDYAWDGTLKKHESYEYGEKHGEQKRSLRIKDQNH